jgi:putative transposase
VILTYKLKHNRDFSQELHKAWQVATYAIKHHAKSSKDVKQFELKSSISNQIIRKYVTNGKRNGRKCKKVSSIKLTLPFQAVKLDQLKQTMEMTCLKLKLPYQFPNNFTKINQVELDNKYAYVSVTVPDGKGQDVEHYLGIDRNTTGHCCVAAIAQTGKVWKLGKKSQHIHTKYSKIRKKLQSQGRKQKLKQIKRKEAHVVRDLNHKISRKIVEIAKQNNVGIKMEDLKQIRQTTKQSRSFKYSLNSWGFYQLQQMVEYKSRLLGIPLLYVASPYTSKTCSRCGLIGKRNGKTFTCRSCGHVDHADSNAAFNISVWKVMAGESYAKPMKRGQSVADRDAAEGSTDTPQIERSMPFVEKQMVLV